MSFTPEEEAMGDRLGTKYNGRAYHPVNDPFAFDRGGNQAGVFTSALKDVAGWGRAVVRVVNGLVGEVRSAVGLTAEDARNTALDRIATAQNVTTSAGHVGAAAAEVGRASGQADRAKTEADRAASFAPDGYAKLDSPALTGNPTAPTQAAATNNAAIATTAFVKSLKATGADVRALNDDLDYVTPKAMADAMAFVTAAATATIAPNLAQGFNRIWTMGLNATLGQPTNLKDGLTVVFGFQQDATGGRTLAFNSTYHKFPGGTVPTLSTAANAYDFMSGVCRNRGGTLVIEWSGLLKDVR